MDSIVLPPQVNYDEKLQSLLPSTQNFTQVLQPVNGSTFTQNSQIWIDIPSRGFIDPKSIYIRYKATATITNNGYVLGCPVYTPFSRLDTYVNSQMIDTITDWNVACHAWSNLYLGVNEKYGVQSGFGYNNITPADVTLNELDGRYMLSTGESYYVSAPLVQCMLANCEKFIPAFATGGIRLIFTLDSNSNMFDSGAGTSTMSISNFELVYDMIDFGHEVEQAVLSSPMISIKSSSVNNTAVSLNTSSVGQMQLVYNTRFQSIRNVIVLPSGTAPNNNTTANGKFDSVDVTNGGFYSLTVGGNVYPQGGPLNAGENKSGILMELRKATGNLYDWSKSMSINNVEFSRSDSSLTSVASTVSQPGKFYVGVDLNKINSGSNMLLNGVSTVNSPINLNLNIKTLTARGYNIYLLSHYDCILNIDSRTRTLSVLQ